MRKILIKIILCFSIIFLTTGCSNSKENLNINNDKKEINIVTTLFPTYDFAKQIAGNKANVTLILPPGADSHTFDPKPNDIVLIQNSDIFVYTGDEMEPWVNKILKSISNTQLKIVDTSKGVKLLKGNHDDHDHHNDDNLGKHEHNHSYDPHIWLDPTNCVKMVDNILEILINVDPKNKDYYTKNASNYKNQLITLDSDISKAVKESDNNTIVFGGHFAYNYFVNRYNIKYINVLPYSSDAEPDIRTMSNVIDTMKKNNIKYVYYEQFANKSIAESIAENSNAQLLPFTSIEQVSKKEMDDGKTYLSFMYQNLENLKKGLEK